MKHFLQKLASSVIRPQPGLHPLAESVYAGRATVDRSKAASEIVVGSSQTQPDAAPPVPMVESRLHRATPRDARELQGEHEVSVPYRPLLPMRETSESAPEHWLARRPQPKQGLPNEHESRAESTRGEPRQTASLISERENQPAGREQSLPVGRPRALVSQSDAKLLMAMRRPGANEQPAARQRQEVRSADDIQINIGRIEVIAVPPAAPRPTPPPARKGMSLDDYLGRRNGRLG
jgi:hypothetical protein